MAIKQWDEMGSIFWDNPILWHKLGPEFGVGYTPWFQSCKWLAPSPYMSCDTVIIPFAGIVGEYVMLKPPSYSKR